jgi:hypothetical protein
MNTLEPPSEDRGMPNEDDNRRSVGWFTRHFRWYRSLSPWKFCWIITVEGLVVMFVVSAAVTLLGAGEREINMDYSTFLVAAVFIAPILETLIFQSFPIWIARLFKASLGVQMAVSTIPFFLAHAIEGIAAGLAAGLIGGLYYSFTYAHWREKGRWPAFWVTALSHAMHNAFLCLMILIFC